MPEKLESRGREPDREDPEDAGYDEFPVEPTLPSGALRIELVEEIPTGHATALALEVTTIAVSSDDDVEVPALAPLALGAPLARAPTVARAAAPFADGAEHLTALLDRVAARAALAVEQRSHGGLAPTCSCSCHATDAAVPSRMACHDDTITARVAASVAAGVELPLLALAEELELSVIAMQLIVAVLAPRARAEIAELYRTLAGYGPPTCDEALLVTLLAGDDTRTRDRLRAELADTSLVMRYGLVTRDARGGLDVDDALLARLRGQPRPRSAAQAIRTTDRALDELAIDRVTLRSLVHALAVPRDPESPARVVIRGRRGSGRHTVIAALAARVDRRIACIDARQLPDGPGRPAALCRELTRAVIARAIPVISGVERRDDDPPTSATLIAQLLRTHPGPLVVRTRVGARVPLDRGAIDVVLAPLSGAARQRAFAAALARHAVPANAERLARHHRIGPGPIEDAVAEARRRLDGDHDPTVVVDAVVRQQVAARLAAAADRVTRLATWEQVRLPDATLDSVRELIGRARHSRTVLGDWGYEPLATARGVTALFCGPPGTGKTMVAGLIARELDVDLYRVDLGKLAKLPDVEDELGGLFDTAEDGGAMLLLDAADRFLTSSDPALSRAGDILVQRLAAFDGIAIVATHGEDTLDPRFARRLEMRVRFALPDEDLRAQLRAAHLTPGPDRRRGRPD
jgi:hypothetical protein